MAYQIWHPQSGKYERCGSDSGCDAYDAEVTYAGPYANLTVGGGIVVFKILTDNRFIEVATLSNSVLVYRGACIAQ